MYKVIIIKKDGSTSILSVNKQSAWEDIKMAKKYVHEVREAINDGFDVFGSVDAFIRDSRGAVWL